MKATFRTISISAITLAMLVIGSRRSLAQHDPWSFILPEQRRIEVRQPHELSRAVLPSIPRPPTISDNQFDAPPRYISLSEAINIGLENLEVVRVLAGITAVNSGRTVYDVAIANTRIDQQRAAFDPNLQVNNFWNRDEPTSLFEDPNNPATAVPGGRLDNHNLDFGLSKRTLTGGIIDFGVNSARNDRRPGIFPANPTTQSSLDLSYTQPLLQSGGAAVNRVPIVLARIDTERSFFQYKDSVQSHVQGVIEAYWALVFSRTDLWAREQQVAQLAFANERAKAELEAGISSLGEVAQTQVAYENFRANLIAAQAAVLQREAAFRNILGLPPYELERLIPVSPLVDDKLEIDWERIVGLAEVQRPDIIELKLILEADQQRLLLSRNQALPRLDGVALYRWNGVEGELPGGGTIASRPGQFTDWNLGVNFSVPLGLRAGRAGLRQQELVIRRDQANLEQGLHQVIHLLAGNLRDLEQFYEQYNRYQDVRKAAKLNLDQQLATSDVGNVQFIVVLQAIVDWGNSVSNEAQALIQYNTELARLERETGTILEAHGIAFYEERFGSIGPLGRLADPQCYPLATQPTDNTIDPYGTTDEPSEEFFDLTVPQTTGRMGDDIEMNIPRPDQSPERLDSVPQPDPKGGVKQDDQSSSPGFGRKLLDGPVRAATAIRGLFKK